MFSIRFDTGDAIELAELLQFLGDWLESDHDNLTESLARFIGSTVYGPDSLRGDFARFRFLLGVTDGKSPVHPGPAVIARLPRRPGQCGASPASVAVMADNTGIRLLGFAGFEASERFLRALDDEIWVARWDSPPRYQRTGQRSWTPARR
jgi:hypothetical protein